MAKYEAEPPFQIRTWRRFNAGALASGARVRSWLRFEPYGARRRHSQRLADSQSTPNGSGAKLGAIPCAVQAEFEGFKIASLRRWHSVSPVWITGGT